MLPKRMLSLIAMFAKAAAKRLNTLKLSVLSAMAVAENALPATEPAPKAAGAVTSIATFALAAVNSSVAANAASAKNPASQPSPANVVDVPAKYALK